MLKNNKVVSADTQILADLYIALKALKSSLKIKLNIYVRAGEPKSGICDRKRHIFRHLA
jgi:hypothetical protein